MTEPTIDTEREDLCDFVRRQLSYGKSQEFFLENRDPDLLIDEEINQMSNTELLAFIFDFLKTEGVVK